MGISINQYANMRGVSPTAVHKAIKSGRITRNDDGSIDPELANEQWATNTDPLRGGDRFTPSGNIPVKDNNPSMSKVKTAHEFYKTQITKIALQEKQGILVDKQKMFATMRAQNKLQRDTWQNFPTRYSALLAADLNVDEALVFRRLEHYIREQLNELGDKSKEFDSVQ